LSVRFFGATSALRASGKLRARENRVHREEGEFDNRLRKSVIDISTNSSSLLSDVRNQNHEDEVSNLLKGFEEKTNKICSDYLNFQNSISNEPANSLIVELAGNTIDLAN
jgi:hypothetical protein